MFHINVTTSIVPGGNFRYFMYGGTSGSESICYPNEQFGPQGAVYLIGVPSMGYMTLADVGATVPGPGAWSVNVSGASSNWFYNGGGQGTVTIDASGGWTLNGGVNTISGKLVPWTDY